MPQLKSDLPDLVEIIEDGGKDKDGKEKKDPAAKEEAKPESGEDSSKKGAVVAAATFVRLLPIQLCAARIESLIKDFDGKLYCSELEAAFVDKYKTPLYPGQFGFPSVNTLIGTGLAKVSTVTSSDTMSGGILT